MRIPKELNGRARVCVCVCDAKRHRRVYIILYLYALYTSYYNMYRIYTF